MDHIENIRMNLSERDLLEQLAEECNELAKASLKLIRAKGMSRNWTPKTLHECEMELKEEILDVLGVLKVMDKLPPLNMIDKYEKLERWSKRLDNGE